ncbi:hypothetical protein [Lentzea sp. NPDC059081]
MTYPLTHPPLLVVPNGLPASPAAAAFTELVLARRVNGDHDLLAGRD